jgi:6-phospho-beta-glucosidase
MEEDVNLLAGMGANAYRMSIAWTRIFPNGDDAVSSAEGLAYYDCLFDLLRERGIEPIVTMSHYEPPLALARRGGWSNPEMIDHFVRYARTLVEHYRDRVRYWLTFNEINCMQVPFGIMTAGGMLVGIRDEKNTEQLRFQALLGQRVPDQPIRLQHELGRPVHGARPGGLRRQELSDQRIHGFDFFDHRLITSAFLGVPGKQ